MTASKKEVHPNYNSKTLTHDICILEFNEALPLDKDANPGMHRNGHFIDIIFLVSIFEN